MRIKVSFESQGHRLSGALETPASDIRCYALFAHCFTCGKDVAAASRISRALTRLGIAVLRFDFTGLGSSDGDFANTNFSSNIEDLIAAADYLRREHQAPALLIGHSLGGAAVLAMAELVPESQAVVTIGAPHDASVIARQFSASLAQIEKDGEADVKMGARTFKIKKQFLDDVDRYRGMPMANLKKALLIMHSPIDEMISIGEAEKIYKDAMHPKSFVSLDSADHLLSRKADAEYAASVIAAWADRYLPKVQSTAPTLSEGQVQVEEKNHQFTVHVHSDSHHWLADEPLAVGGDNMGPDPYEHLLAALGACTVMTLRMYAERKEWPLEHIAVRLSHHREHGQDCKDCTDKDTAIEVIERNISLKGDLSDEQRQRLLEIANKCPVHRTLHSELRVRSQLS
ncbi:bifunctional alpha/beta hydrolase/OsmC family protein [Aliiglaciecola sp. CAU 1673]|uniref:bifunctional alpha/beta hydrolase/OsmC family protein n=1 Tax=Aliiglaciecola sp. CAU 1673 TaxID=3032595 RepID=UPI0023DCB230|nr:bifunctional alpha/beta hydrolase/OsmC family protein [Aliiglaciecola sp. CAU 1673]MDF2178163.1 bifunctional alpha/beta hydrolase/OsmC family protein [Aliiglaciecola sp. CAU 1673]